jgi:hypothetical protein
MRQSRGWKCCESCGKSFEDKGFGSPRKYCSARCRWAASIARRVQQELAKPTEKQPTSQDAA